MSALPAVVQTRTLVRRGFPLPRTSDGLPVPYIAGRDGHHVPQLGLVSPDRAEECVTGYACQVCGLPVAGDVAGAVLVLLSVREMAEPIATTYPGGPLHPHCLRVSLDVCPHLAGPRFRVIAARRSSLRVMHREGGWGEGRRRAHGYALVGPWRDVTAAYVGCGRAAMVDGWESVEAEAERARELADADAAAADDGDLVDEGDTPGGAFSVRVSDAASQRLRRAAADRSVPVSVLVRQWVLGCLADLEES